MNRGSPSAGPSNDPCGGNSGFGGNPGPGGNRPPSNELGINQLSGNKDNHDKDQKKDFFSHLFSKDIKKHYPSDQVKPEVLSGPTDKSTRCLSQLRCQETLEDMSPSASGSRGPGVNHILTEIDLNTNGPATTIQHRHLTCTYAYDNGTFLWARLQGNNPSNYIFINDYTKFTS